MGALTYISLFLCETTDADPSQAIASGRMPWQEAKKNVPVTARSAVTGFHAENNYKLNFIENDFIENDWPRC